MENVTFKIKRYDPADGRVWDQAYTFPVREGMTVLEGLWHIVHHMDGGLSFRYSCRGAVCGSCAMVINKTITLACHTQIASLGMDTVTLEPLPRMTLIKDLVVDLEVFLEKYNAIQPFVVHGEAHEREVLQSPAERRQIFDSVKCILCTSCHAACPLTAVDEEYLGPAVLTAAQRFAFDTRNDMADEVLNGVNSLSGALECRTISRCTEVCPKEIQPSIRINEIKGRIADYGREGKLKQGGEES